MLLFSPAQAPSGLAAFPDHRDPQRLFYLPTALTLARLPDGDPSFFLLRYRDDLDASGGGLMRLELELAKPDGDALEQAVARGFQPRPVSFTGARLRLRLRAGLGPEPAEPGEETGGEPDEGFEPAVLRGDRLAATAVHLSRQRSDLLHQLLDLDDAVVDVEAELRYQGLVPGMPWLASARGRQLGERLSTILGEEPASLEQVKAAFLSLPGDGTVRFEALDAAAPGNEEALGLELARRAVGDLFEVEGHQYRLRPLAELPERISWSLLTPRLEQRRHRLTWSIAELFRGLDDAGRGRLFPTVSQIGPFERVKVWIVNPLPLDPEHLRQVRVELSFPGPSGLPERRTVVFDAPPNPAPGEQDTDASSPDDGGPAAMDRGVASFETVFPAFATRFELEYRVTLTLAPAGGVGFPRVVRGETRRAPGLVVEVRPEDVGVDFLHVEAEAPVFGAAASVSVEVRPEGTDADAPPTTLELTAGRPAAWLALPGVLPGQTLLARGVARASRSELEGAEFTFLDGALTGRELRVTASDLEVLEPDRVTLSLDPAVADRFRFVAAEMAPAEAPPEADGRLFPLKAGEPRLFTFFRSSVFESPRYRYRVHSVAFRDDGSTLPLERSDWLFGEADPLLIRPDVPGQVPAPGPDAEQDPDTEPADADPATPTHP